MTERYSFIDGSVVWNQDNMDGSTLTDPINESYATAEEDSPTRYLSVLDATTDISLDNLNITLSNPKLEIEDSAESYGTEEGIEQLEEGADQVVVISVEGSDELFGIQVMQDEEGNLQKYQFQFRKNEEGQLEAIPETITLIPMEDEACVEEPPEQDTVYANPIEETAVHVYVQEDNSGEHILPDHIEQHVEEMEEEETNIYDDEVEEEAEDIKPGLLQLQGVSVKQEVHDPQSEYSASDLMESHEPFSENVENEQLSEFENLPEPTEEQETNFEYETNAEEQQSQEENSVASKCRENEDEAEPADSCEPEVEVEEGQEEFQQLEENHDADPSQAVENAQEDEEEEEEEGEEEEEETHHFQAEPAPNDSDENDYEIVEGLHITGDAESNEDSVDRFPTSNILRHALKTNKEASKIVKKDNKLYLYVVQHPEKENVDSLSLEMSNLCRPKVNPRSILKSSHAMFQSKNEIENDEVQDERLNKRFARCKEAMQAMLFHNFINKTTIPQAPVRKNRLPRKQKIKPVDRMDEEIVVQEVMVSSNGFVEAVNAGMNKENLAVTEYVELTDSDDDYDPKKVNRKKRKHRRKRIEITISDDSDGSHDSVIELDESDDEVTNEETQMFNNNSSPPKRRRGRPPKSKPDDEYPITSAESPAKKSRVEDPMEPPTKPEIPCPKCNKTFPSQNSLKTHLQHHSLQSSMKRVLPEYKYKCDKCATTFINNILLKKHMCSKLLSCTVCKKRYPDLSSLNGHKRTHAKQQMVKSTAVAQVSPKKPRPVQPTHTFKSPKLSNFKCKTCGKPCSSLQNLSVHVRSHKDFVCGTCSKSFPSQLMLEKHVRENCVKSPQHSRRSLRIKSGGDRQKVYGSKVKCESCSMQFISYQELFKHKVAKHGLQTPDKRVLEREEAKVSGRGIPAAKKLQCVYADLKCQLDFNL